MADNKKSGRPPPVRMKGKTGMDEGGGIQLTKTSKTKLEAPNEDKPKETSGMQLTKTSKTKLEASNEDKPKETLDDDIKPLGSYDGDDTEAETSEYDTDFDIKQLEFSGGEDVEAETLDYDIENWRKQLAAEQPGGKPDEKLKLTLGFGPLLRVPFGGGVLSISSKPEDVTESSEESLSISASGSALELPGEEEIPEVEEIREAEEIPEAEEILEEQTHEETISNETYGVTTSEEGTSEVVEEILEAEEPKKTISTKSCGKTYVIEDRDNDVKKPKCSWCYASKYNVRERKAEVSKNRTSSKGAMDKISLSASLPQMTQKHADSEEPENGLSAETTDSFPTIYLMQPRREMQDVQSQELILSEGELVICIPPDYDSVTEMAYLMNKGQFSPPMTSATVIIQESPTPESIERREKDSHPPIDRKQIKVERRTVRYKGAHTAHVPVSVVKDKKDGTAGESSDAALGSSGVCSRHSPPDIGIPVRRVNRQVSPPDKEVAPRILTKAASSDMMREKDKIELPKKSNSTPFPCTMKEKPAMVDKKETSPVNRQVLPSDTEVVPRLTLTKTTSAKLREKDKIELPRKCISTPFPYTEKEKPAMVNEKESASEEGVIEEEEEYGELFPLPPTSTMIVTVKAKGTKDQEIFITDKPHELLWEDTLSLPESSSTSDDDRYSMQEDEVGDDEDEDGEDHRRHHRAGMRNKSWRRKKEKTTKEGKVTDEETFSECDLHVHFDPHEVIYMADFPDKKVDEESSEEEAEFYSLDEFNLEKVDLTESLCEDPSKQTFIEQIVRELLEPKEGAGRKETAVDRRKKIDVRVTIKDSKGHSLKSELTVRIPNITERYVSKGTLTPKEFAQDTTKTLEEVRDVLEDVIDRAVSTSTRTAADRVHSVLEEITEKIGTDDARSKVAGRHSILDMSDVFVNKIEDDGENDSLVETPTPSREKWKTVLRRTVSAPGRLAEDERPLKAHYNTPVDSAYGLRPLAVSDEDDDDEVVEDIRKLVSTLADKVPKKKKFGWNCTQSKKNDSNSKIMHAKFGGYLSVRTKYY